MLKYTVLILQPYKVQLFQFGEIFIPPIILAYRVTHTHAHTH